MMTFTLPTTRSVASPTVAVVVVIVLLVAVGSSAPVAAAPVFFTDLPSFDAAVGGSYQLETFNGPDKWTFNFVLDACGRSFANVGIGYDCHDVGIGQSPPYLQTSSLFVSVIGFSGGVNDQPQAVGFDYGVAMGGPMTVRFRHYTLGDGIGYHDIASVSLTGYGFFGIIAPEGIVNIDILGGGPPPSLLTPFSLLLIDNLRTVQTLPEPGTFVLLMSAVLVTAVAIFLIRFRPSRIDRGAS